MNEHPCKRENLDKSSSYLTARRKYKSLDRQKQRPSMGSQHLKKLPIVRYAKNFPPSPSPFCTSTGVCHIANLNRENFLGDSKVGMISMFPSQWIFLRYPPSNIHHKKIHLVSEHSVGRFYQLGTFPSYSFELRTLLFFLYTFYNFLVNTGVPQLLSTRYWQYWKRSTQIHRRAYTENWTCDISKITLTCKRSYNTL